MDNTATMNKHGQIVPLALCATCGAKCWEVKALGRFNRRHPALCVARKEFNKQLAVGVRAVILLLVTVFIARGQTPITIDSGAATDQFFTGGTAYTIPAPVPPAINDTTSRYGNFSYSIPAIPGAQYTINFNLVEMTVASPGLRRMKITINGVVAFDQLDIFTQCGGFMIPCMVSATTTPLTGINSIVFTTETRNAVVESIVVMPPVLPPPPTSAAGCPTTSTYTTGTYIPYVYIDATGKQVTDCAQLNAGIYIDRNTSPPSLWITMASISYTYGEVPGGAIDGTNTLFGLLHSPVAGSDILYLNEKPLVNGTDYTINSAAMTITFTTPPPVGSYLMVIYRYS